MLILYHKTTGKIYSYINVTWEYDKESNLIVPSVEKCASNNGVSSTDIGTAKFLISDPNNADYKDNINDLDPGDYEVL